MAVSSWAGGGHDDGPGQPLSGALDCNDWSLAIEAVSTADEVATETMSTVDEVAAEAALTPS